MATRLVDHLRDESIRLSFAAGSMAELIETLADVAVSAHGLHDPRRTLAASAVAREQDMSTCLGAGLAVPHGELPEGAEPVAALAVCVDGLPMPTPDGMPVQFAVLLGVPADRREHHVHVLADIAGSLGSDLELREAIRAAKAAATVLELLRAHIP